jgi:hypothetical protein
MQRTVAAAAGAPGAAVIRAPNLPAVVCHVGRVPRLAPLHAARASGRCPPAPATRVCRARPHLAQGTEARGLDGCLVHEDVLAPVVGRDEAKPLDRVEPLHLHRREARREQGVRAARGTRQSTTTAAPTTLQGPHHSPPQSIAKPRALPAFLMSAMTASEADLLSDAWKKGFLEETRSRRRRPRHHSPRSCGSGSRGPGSVQVSLGSHCDAPDTAASAPDLAP